MMLHVATAFLVLQGILPALEVPCQDQCTGCGGRSQVRCGSCGGRGWISAGVGGYGCTACGGRRGEPFDRDSSEYGKGRAGSGSVSCRTCSGTGQGPMAMAARRERERAEEARRREEEEQRRREHEAYRKKLEERLSKEAEENARKVEERLRRKDATGEPVAPGAVIESIRKDLNAIDRERDLAVFDRSVAVARAALLEQVQQDAPKVTAAADEILKLRNRNAPEVKITERWDRGPRLAIRPPPAPSMEDQEQRRFLADVRSRIRLLLDETRRSLKAKAPRLLRSLDEESREAIANKIDELFDEALAGLPHGARFQKGFRAGKELTGRIVPELVDETFGSASAAARTLGSRDGDASEARSVEERLERVREKTARSVWELK